METRITRSAALTAPPPPGRPGGGHDPAPPRPNGQTSNPGIEYLDSAAFMSHAHPDTPATSSPGTADVGRPGDHHPTVPNPDVTTRDRHRTRPQPVKQIALAGVVQGEPGLGQRQGDVAGERRQRIIGAGTRQSRELRL